VINQRLIIDVVEKALSLDLAFQSNSGGVRHVPFALTPGPVALSDFTTGKKDSVLLGRLTQALANDSELIQSLHAPLTEGDPFFAELLSMHSELTEGNTGLPRLPLLLQRSDFMLDIENGPQLVECNSIAAGMAPFGEQIQHLHEYIRQQWPREFAQFTTGTSGGAVINDAISNLSGAIAEAAEQVRAEHNDGGAASFLMVIQENEDNVFDQFLLERALSERGVRTFRRTFRELHEQLSSGANERLLLQGCGPIDVVYLRAGYQYRDYLAVDLDTRRCCDALRETRIFIERHRVAVNATVAQQLATSKRTQQYLSEASAADWLRFDLQPDEVQTLRSTVTEMRSIDRNTAQWLQESGGTENWVLKNQGEGGGHCLFDESIAEQLKGMPESDFAAWTLMRRLRPVNRQAGTVLVRDGRAENVQDLVSELGFFTAHLADQPLLGSGEDKSAYLGYLVRSKPPAVTEGGIHSGYGVLDSLTCA
jgi:glutathione synthetase